MRGGATLVDALGVVDVRRAVHGEADEEAVLGEEGRPGLVEERPVRLDGVLDDLAGPTVALTSSRRPRKKSQAHERGLATLPGDGHPLRAMRLEQLAHVLVQDAVVHAEGAAGVEGLLGEEEAVRAVEVADGAARLDEDVEGRRRRRRQWVGQHGELARRGAGAPGVGARRLGDPVRMSRRLKVWLGSIARA